MRIKTTKICAALCALICAVSLILTLGGSKFALGDVTQINLADYGSFHWTDGVNPLRSGTVYRYRYVTEEGWQDYYTTSQFEAAPDPEWQNWSLYTVNDAPYSIFEYRASGMHTVSVLIPALSTSAYTVDYEGNFAQGAGEYIAKAVIKPVNSSVKFVFDADGVVDIKGRGMSVVIDADGTATVTKIWYVARFESELLNEAASIENGEETAYTMQNWTFGGFPEGGIAIPRLMHGDEVKGLTYQPEGYWLKVAGFTENVVEITNNEIRWNEEWRSGNNDIVTFTLTLNGETVCENLPRSRWTEYINAYTPAGSYELKFSVKSITIGSHHAWWSDALDFPSDEGLEYSAFTRTYAFEVYKAEINVDFPDGEVYELTDGNYSDIFGSVLENCVFTDYMSAADVTGSDTFWADNAGKYFGAPVITYCVVGSQGGYLPSEEIADCFETAGEYTVLCKITLPNYDCGDEIHYFKVIVPDASPENGGNGEGQPAKTQKSGGLIAAICVESVVILALLGALIGISVAKKRTK